MTKTLIRNVYLPYFNGRNSWRDSNNTRHIAVYYQSSTRRWKIKKKKDIDRSVTRWLSILSRSRKKELDCDLELQDVKYLLDSPCIYCGSLERIEVDRMDSSKGYTRLNIAPACHRCNTIKSNVVSYEEMMTIVDILGWRL